jgi:hypothetical protein
MNRPDPYQERARALAIAAGLDPDARIERPGLRSMPTWCTFRDAARAEHLAREQAAAAAEIATSSTCRPDRRTSGNEVPRLDSSPRAARFFPCPCSGWRTGKMASPAY